MTVTAPKAHITQKYAKYAVSPTCVGVCEATGRCDCKPTETTIRLRREVTGIVKQVPNLTDFGLGVSDDQIFEVERAKMFEPRSLYEFDLARRWLEQFGKTKRFNPGRSSYGLKHAAGKDIGYVTNGMFIAALIAAGFTVEQEHYKSPNVKINISERDLNSHFNPRRSRSERW